IPIHGVIHQKYPDHSHYPVEQCHIAIAAKSGAQARVDDEVFWHKDGSAVPVSYSASPILVDGKPAGAVVTYTDVTRRKQTEEDLRSLAAQLSEANRRKGEFLATLAHELRNPLAPMRTGLSLMRLSGSNPETVGRVTDMLERQVAHMVHLVDDLLDVARISSGKVALKKSRIALHDIFAGAIETSRPTIDSANHTLSVDLPDGPIWLDADPIRLTQVLDNLLTNAAKYTPPNGRIGLSATRDGAAILIAVSDSGVGISAAAMPTLFDMFTQIGKHLSQSQGGLGIGLSLVRHLVELHDGEVMVYSEGEGAGSTFTVRLPLACEMPEAAPVPPMTANLDAAPVRSLRVVIADDNQDAALALGQLLSLQGHSVHVVHDGDAALQLMRTFAPDIMILDIGMPVMNGYEVARAVRLAALPAAPVLIALTGWGTDKDRARATEAGFDYHFTKPGKSSEIAALFATIAGKRRAGAINKATE
ncbi:MAG: ATP-binding protein, partial [Telluria sp.]